MTGKLLQVIGVITVLGLVVGSIAGFGILKDRVRVVIEADDTDLGPDPTALLRDEVQSLAGDLKALQAAVASNFEQLASGLESGAETRHGDVKQLQRNVMQLLSQQQQLQATQAQVQANVRELQAAGQVVATSSDPAGSPDAVAEQPVEVAVEPVVVPETRVEELPVEATPVEAPPAKKAGGFLSFSVPSTRLAFDQPQEYQLLPKLCRVGFDAKSTLHDFTGVTSAVSGSFRADFDDPKGLCEGEVVATAGTLKTGVDGRDTNMWEYLDSKSHPEIRFAIERFQATGEGVDLAARKAAGEVIGKMTIRGKTLDLRVPVKIEVDPQQRVVITGQQKLKLSDYGVPVPSQLGVINMEDEVVIWLALRARAQAEASK